MTRSRTSTLIASGIGLTILLGIVAFASRGHISPAGGGGENRGASQTLANMVLTVWALAMVAGALLVAWLLAQRKWARESPQAFRLRPLVGTLLFFAFFVISIVIAQSRLGNNSGQERPRQSPLSALAKMQNAERSAKRPQTPSFDWRLAAGIIALLIGVALTAILRSRRKRQQLVAEVVLAQELFQVLDETLDDLRKEADPRKAVIAAYARMERILGAHGLPRRPSEAPLEYLGRVLVELKVSEAAVERLTRLFERAKFSTHEIGPGMKEQAIEALVSLRDDLRVIDAPLDPPALRLQDVPGHAP